jgi:glycine dehydrogenase
MLTTIGSASLEVMSKKVLPAEIAYEAELPVPAPLAEHEALALLKSYADNNQLYKSWLGQGYYNTHTPLVIKRGILENSGWYTSYTPYQPEISQGRLESLLNFQTMVSDLTDLAVSTASLLDESTAAAEAMILSYRNQVDQQKNCFFIAADCHPHTIEVVSGRAEALGIRIIVGASEQMDFSAGLFGLLLSYPGTTGQVEDYRELISRAHQHQVLVSVACDLLSLALLTPPGELGADIAFGNSQRFGVPLGYGGPHAGFFAAREEFSRKMPGRIVGVSRDRLGNPAYRLALQTREQHIRREKATSNICTAQALLANIAAMYAVYHGPKGIREIATHVHSLAKNFGESLLSQGYQLEAHSFFDTVGIKCTSTQADKIIAAALQEKINLRRAHACLLAVSFDETTTEADVTALVKIFSHHQQKGEAARGTPTLGIPRSLQRQSSFLTHAVFNRYHSETEMMRYLKRLEQKDFSLTTSMIPLGSCTMKLNSVSELEPISWPQFSGLHPFVPLNQATGYHQLFRDLQEMLAALTGFSAVSLQPNSGAQGEYAGLMAIRAYHRARGDKDRNLCLIPLSAHGTNPASAIMAGFRVETVRCDAQGNIDLGDLRQKVAQHSAQLAAFMVTYPSTHGVFEQSIKEVCALIHQHGGQVYLDGANMNAQIGLCRPGDYGADVCHINLHKTFCIPHGGGGPGVGPIAVKAHLAPYLPGHPYLTQAGEAKGAKPVSAAPWGSAGILPISWMYMRMMGPAGLKRATQVAILNANYIAHRLEKHFPILYRGSSGMVAHECLIDLRPLKASSGVEVGDVAKRLMDYGFHAPTVSFPVAGTMMIEPTESEGLEEIERFCTAMEMICREIAEIEEGQYDRSNNVLKNAPHTVQMACSDEWKYPYSREKAVYPAAWLRVQKVWPAVGRIDEAYGDRNFYSCCPGLE